MGISSNKHTLLPNDAVLQQMKNLRHLPDQNLNFGGAWRVTTEKALKDIYSVKCRENNTYIVQAKPKSKICYYSLYQRKSVLQQKIIIASTCQYFKQTHTTTFTILE